MLQLKAAKRSQLIMETRNKFLHEVITICDHLSENWSLVNVQSKILNVAVRVFTRRVSNSWAIFHASFSLMLYLHQRCTIIRSTVILYSAKLCLARQLKLWKIGRFQILGKKAMANTPIWNIGSGKTLANSRKFNSIAISFSQLLS